MGARAEIIGSNLPFGVGSLHESSSQLIETEFDDNFPEQNEESEVEIVQELDPPPPAEIPVSEEPIMEPEIEPILEPEVTSSAELPVRVEPLAEPESPSAEMPVRIEPIVEPQVASIEIPKPDSTPVRLKATHDVLPEDVPDIWRIDATAADMDEIYAESETIVEVSYGEDSVTDEVIVQFDDFHYEAEEASLFSVKDSPELHPARAMEVNTTGEPTLATIVESAFEQMGSGSWLQAAQMLQGASGIRPNDPAILNNMGLALLQQSLEMDTAGDSMASSQYEAAIMALRQAAKIDTSNNTILLNLAHTLLVSGRAQKALGVAEVLCSRDLGNMEAENVRGACLIQLGRGEEAKMILQPYSNDEIIAANIGRI